MIERKRRFLPLNLKRENANAVNNARKTDNSVEEEATIIEFIRYDGKRENFVKPPYP
jgi:hypothetical protein